MLQKKYKMFTCDNVYAVLRCNDTMKKKLLFSILICTMLAMSMTACGSKEDEPEASAETKEEQIQDTTKPESKKNPVKVNSGNEQKEKEVSDQDLFNAFLKDQAEVHFNNYQPEKYYEINEYMFKKDDTATLSELLAVYNKYYLEELAYSDIFYNLSYTYIDAGDAGKQQLVVESDFPRGSGAQFIIGAENGQLEMMYVIDSRERVYGTVANKYGLITITGSSSYAEYDVDNKYLDENGTIHNLYIESVNYNFGQDTGLADPLLEWAADFKAQEGFKDDVILKTYCFDEYRSDFTEGEEEAYYDGMLYTVEYVTDEEPWHEAEMYEEGSIFRRIFEKAHRKLSTPEEIAEEIAKREEELKMPKKAMEEDPVILDDFTEAEVGAVLGADVTDGKSELEHALIAYSKFLKNPVNMCEILTEQTYSPYGNAQPGMVYGFALRDFNEDKIPELVIDFGQPALPLMQKIYIYSYNEGDGMVRRMFKMENGGNGEYGLEYLKENMNESFVEQYNEELEQRISDCADYADSLLHVKYQGPHMVGTCGRYLVAFNNGVEEDMSMELRWYDFVEDNAQSYTEYLTYMDEGYLDYSTDESCEDDPEGILNNFKPILFYDITDENIEKVVSRDYWNANSGDGAFSDYTDEDAYHYLTEKSKWYYDLGIMDDDDSYDSISCYDYDEETGVSTAIYFDLDKRIQSHFRVDRF